jgi:hypothetical protein
MIEYFARVCPACNGDAVVRRPEHNTLAASQQLDLVPFLPCQLIYVTSAAYSEQTITKSRYMWLHQNTRRDPFKIRSHGGFLPLHFRVRGFKYL